MSLAAGAAGRALNENAGAKVAEIGLVALVAFLTIAGGWRLVGEAPLARQAVVWIANVLMLLVIWLGLHLRGQTPEQLGLSLRPGGTRAVLRTILQALVVLVIALLAFVAGSVLMARAAASGETADMSGYSYLQGNLPMLILALAAVYVVSSFGEEVIYRGFLMNRVAEITGGRSVAWASAVLVSSVAFGLVHFSWGIVGVVQTTLMGFALAVSYLVVKRNLWVLVLAHACIDSLLLIQLYMGPAAAGAG
jgi:CAAX protease family protein